MDVTINLTKQTDEYVVKVTESGVRNPDADYFTDDLSDAVDTALDMGKRYRKVGAKVTIKL